MAVWNDITVSILYPIHSQQACMVNDVGECTIWGLNLHMWLQEPFLYHHIPVEKSL